jgi:hypothetical protein
MNLFVLLQQAPLSAETGRLASLAFDDQHGALDSFQAEQTS